MKTILFVMMTVIAAAISCYMNRNEKAEICLMKTLLFLLPFAAGGFYSYLAVPVSTLLIVFLLRNGRQHRRPVVYLNLPFVSLCCLFLLYAASILWAADRGMSVYGWVRSLPLVLFAVCLMQMPDTEAKDLLQDMPISAALMTGLSFPLQFFPALSDIIAPAGRLAGFYEYANTYALFLLISLSIQWTKEKRGKTDYVLDAFLMIGVFISGSRTSFLLLVLLLAGCCLIRKNIRFAVTIASVFLAILALSLALKDILPAAARYQTISAQSSTMLGRLLYYKDAIPVILRHPFGLGYMGYAAIQGSVQTGYYTVSFVHNGFLQILLDVGWIPGGLLCAVALKTVFNRETPWSTRLPLLMIFSHCMVDFDLQYLSIWFITISLLPLKQGKRVELRGRSAFTTVFASALIACGLWLGTGDVAFCAGKHRLCRAVTPFYTNEQVLYLTELSDPNGLDETAEYILSLNRYSSIAHSAKANAAFARGDITGMIQEKENAISCSRYQIAEYTDYFEKLHTAMQLYIQQGDTDSADFCRERLLRIPAMLETLEEQTESLAWKLTDQPEMLLPEEYQKILSQIQPS